MHTVNKAAAGNVAFIPLAILLCIHAWLQHAVPPIIQTSSLHF